MNAVLFALLALPPQAPPMPPAQAPACRVRATCPCSPACTCGCNEGKPCTCGNPTIPAAAEWWRPRYPIDMNGVPRANEPEQRYYPAVEGATETGPAPI